MLAQRCSAGGRAVAQLSSVAPRPALAGSLRCTPVQQQQALAGPQGRAPRQLALRVAATQAGSRGGSAEGGTRSGKKPKQKKMVDLTGDVTKDLSNGMFQIKLENGVTVIGHLSGKIRQNRIRVVVGDKVTVELSPYDLTKGRITLRHKPGGPTPASSMTDSMASTASVDSMDQQ